MGSDKSTQKENSIIFLGLDLNINSLSLALLTHTSIFALEHKSNVLKNIIFCCVKSLSGG